jgi:hypothetical protein
MTPAIHATPARSPPPHPTPPTDANLGATVWRAPHQLPRHRAQLIRPASAARLADVSERQGSSRRPEGRREQGAPAAMCRQCVTPLVRTGTGKARNAAQAQQQVPLAPIDSLPAASLRGPSGSSLCTPSAVQQGGTSHKPTTLKREAQPLPRVPRSCTAWSAQGIPRTAAADEPYTHCGGGQATGVTAVSSTRLQVIHVSQAR